MEIIGRKELWYGNSLCFSDIGGNGSIRYPGDGKG